MTSAKTAKARANIKWKKYLFVIDRKIIDATPSGIDTNSLRGRFTFFCCQT